MEIQRLGPAFMLPNGTNSTSATNRGQSFAQVFDHYMRHVNQQLLESEKLTAQLAAGEVKNLHDVTIAAQKASIALQLTVTVRDKALEAYQEVMRMQI